MSRIIRLFIMSLMFRSMSVLAAGCVVDTSSGLNFGQYDVFDFVATDSESIVTVTCDLLSPPLISVELGASSVSGSILQRQMQHSSSASRLDYNLFIDAARTLVWGDYSAGAPLTLLNINDGNPRQLRVYGRIPPGQNASVGSYSDNVMVTILP